MQALTAQLKSFVQIIEMMSSRGSQRFSTALFREQTGQIAKTAVSRWDFPIGRETFDYADLTELEEKIVDEMVLLLNEFSFNFVEEHLTKVKARRAEGSAVDAITVDRTQELYDALKRTIASCAKPHSDDPGWRGTFLEEDTVLKAVFSGILRELETAATIAYRKITA